RRNEQCGDDALFHGLVGPGIVLRVSTSVLLLLDLRAGLTIAPFAPGELGQRILQAALVEVRPEYVAEDQFAIGQLPEQKIADTLFAAGPDEKIDRRQVRKAEEWR